MRRPRRARGRNGGAVGRVDGVAEELGALVRLVALVRATGAEEGVAENLADAVVGLDALGEGVQSRGAVARALLVLGDALELLKLAAEARHADARRHRGVPRAGVDAHARGGTGGRDGTT